MQKILTSFAAGLLCLGLILGVAFADGGRGTDGGGSAISPAAPEKDSAVQRALDRLLLVFGDGGSDEISQLYLGVAGMADLSVTVDVRFVTVSDNFFERIGTDFDFNVDDARYDEANRVGNAYRAGDGALFIALSPSVVEKSSTPRLGAPSIVFLNQDNHIELDAPDFSQSLSQRELNIALGELGQLGSIRTLTAPKADSLNRSVVTGSLNEADYQDANELPFIGEIPILKSFFAGRVHQDAKRNLIVFVKPTILLPEEQ